MLSPGRLNLVIVVNFPEGSIYKSENIYSIEIGCCDIHGASQGDRLQTKKGMLYEVHLVNGNDKRESVRNRLKQIKEEKENISSQKKHNSSSDEFRLLVKNHPRKMKGECSVR